MYCTLSMLVYVLAVWTVGTVRLKYKALFVKSLSNLFLEPTSTDIQQKSCSRKWQWLCWTTWWTQVSYYFLHFGKIAIIVFCISSLGTPICLYAVLRNVLHKPPTTPPVDIFNNLFLFFRWSDLLITRYIKRNQKVKLGGISIKNKIAELHIESVWW